MYETFPHTADLGLRIRAADPDSLFADAGRGLFSIMVADLDTVRPVYERTFQIAGDELDLLLFDWLSELLYTFHAEQMLLVQFGVHRRWGGLHAVCRGEPLDCSRHEIEHEVKAITYHALKVERVGDGYLAEVIVDI